VSSALRVRSLQLHRAERAILKGVDLDVEPGEVCVLMGISGAGKSTVLRAIAALEPFSGGTIDVGDFPLRAGPLPRQSRLKGLRSKVGMVFQMHSLFEHLTVTQNVVLAPVHALGWDRKRAEEVAAKLLQSLGISHRANAYPRQLSGGEAQRVAIARALAPDPTLLLMDEPTSALDPARRGALGETLRGLARQGRALLISTHDLDFARAFADRIGVLADGLLVESGTPEQVLERPTHPATRELLSSPKTSPEAV
jgi:ABC-type polar amino acid transport system ATPase subunit